MQEDWKKCISTDLIEPLDKGAYGGPRGVASLRRSAAQVQRDLPQVVDGWHLVEQLVLCVCESQRHLLGKVQQPLQLLQLGRVQHLQWHHGALHQICKTQPLTLSLPSTVL